MFNKTKVINQSSLEKNPTFGCSKISFYFIQIFYLNLLWLKTSVWVSLEFLEVKNDFSLLLKYFCTENVFLIPKIRKINLCFHQPKNLNIYMYRRFPRWTSFRSEIIFRSRYCKLPRSETEVFQWRFGKVFSSLSHVSRKSNWHLEVHHLLLYTNLLFISWLCHRIIVAPSFGL